MQQAQSLTPQTNLVRTSNKADFGGQPPIAVDWQTAMKRAIRSGQVLRETLGLPPLSAKAENTADDTISLGEAVSTRNSIPDFPTFVPLEFLSRIQPGRLDDPLLRQVLPVADEFNSVDGFGSDPVGDLAAMPTAGVLHKYDGRALVIATGACGVHCRYCFRREFPYSDAGNAKESYRKVLQYIRDTPTIDEVLLSGGDPLTLVDEKLFDLISQIESIPHVQRLRFHSRMPIVIPQRVTTELVDRLKQSRLTVWFVIHMNHAQEWDTSVSQAIAKLIDAGIPVLNQAVLLRGVNESVDALAELSQTLINHRVQPYYLHQLDRVQGAAHFEVPVSVGLQLIEQLRSRLPGYAVPTYVRECEGELSKSVL
ncbi:MAG: EF-P beta-lysylation protein EpmB [Pirellulaceae bacterium]